MTRKENEKNWLETANHLLKGKKIVAVRLMTSTEQEALAWHSRPFVMVLDDGSTWYPSSDDEGNNAGALFGHKGKDDYTLPVMA